MSDKEKRLSQEAINSPFCSSKPPSRSGSVTESLNGSSSGLSNYYHSFFSAPLFMKQKISHGTWNFAS